VSVVAHSRFAAAASVRLGLMRMNMVVVGLRQMSRLIHKLSQAMITTEVERLSGTLDVEGGCLVDLHTANGIGFHGCWIARL
jgi:hypothetical protein